MWNCDGRWIDVDSYLSKWNAKPPEILAYDASSGSFTSVARCDMIDTLTYMKREKEDTEHMSVQQELNKVAEITKKEIAKAWTREYVNSFCSVKSIEVSADHKTVVVIWTDGDKTMVKRSAKDPDDLYMAFTAALAKKVYGSNSAIKRLINKKENEHKPKEKKETLGPRVSMRSVVWKKREETE